VSILRRIQNAVARSPANEAIVRMTIDSLLIFAHEIAAASLSDQQVNTISIQAEKTWKYTSVKHRSKEYVLLGRPDYGAWYGDPQHDALNLVAVEAKRADASSNGLPQALAYMGKYLVITMIEKQANCLKACVHKKRLEAEKLHCRVYGVSVDSQGFHFLKINDDGTVSISQIPLTSESLILTVDSGVNSLCLSGLMSMSKSLAFLFTCSSRLPRCHPRLRSDPHVTGKSTLASQTCPLMRMQIWRMLEGS
jgi:hypothetical protein